MKPTFQTIYLAALAKRQAQCKCAKGGEPSLACSVHKAQAQAAIALEAKLNAKLEESTLDYDFLGIHLLPKKHGYLVRFVTYDKGKRQARFAILWQCGENLKNTRHKFSIFAFDQDIADSPTPLAILFHTTPASVSLTRPFVFHALQQATEEAKRMIEIQCPIDEI